MLFLMQFDNELDISVEFCQPNYNLGIHTYDLMSLQSASIIIIIKYIL